MLGIGVLGSLPPKALSVAPMPTYARAVTATRGIAAPTGAKNVKKTVTIDNAMGKRTSTRTDVGSLAMLNSHLHSVESHGI